ncbi:MAG: hypothetical protein RQ833_01290 [Sphingomonadaceae bacterium]|nr:hypothetical protein [Sphingomonadaceae bacterium]
MKKALLGVLTALGLAAGVAAPASAQTFGFQVYGGDYRGYGQPYYRDRYGVYNYGYGDRWREREWLRREWREREWRRREWERRHAYWHDRYYRGW